MFHMRIRQSPYYVGREKTQIRSTGTNNTINFTQVAPAYEAVFHKLRETQSFENETVLAVFNLCQARDN